MKPEIPNYCVHNEKEIKGFFGKYRWMSNFWPCVVYYEGLRYPYSENAFQAAKTKDVYERIKFIDNKAIIKVLKPHEAKIEGRKLKCREDWGEVKYDIMSSIVFDKFFRNKELRQKLIETGDAYLQELNAWNDIIWGVDVRTGKGMNYLGKILMQTRGFWTWTEKKKPIMHYHSDADYFAGLNFAPHSITQSGQKPFDDPLKGKCQLNDDLPLGY